MRSEKQIIAPPANGARSRGPQTPEGKYRSSRNASRHGLLANITVLQEEPSEAFREPFHSFADRFGPLDDVEIGIVEEMLATYWRLRRVWAIENRYFDTAMAAQTSPSPTDRLMDAFTGLAESNEVAQASLPALQTPPPKPSPHTKRTQELLSLQQIPPRRTQAGPTNRPPTQAQAKLRGFW